MSVALNGIDKQSIHVNGVQVKQSLDPANETVSKGVYAATTLSTVDTDLAVGNINNGVTIFGFVGTYTGPTTPAQDILGSAISSIVANYNGSAWSQLSVSASSDSATIATLTQSYAAASMAVGIGMVSAKDNTGSENIKLRLYMDGVQMAESGYFSNLQAIPVVIMATKAMSGSKTCYIAAHNYSGSIQYLNIYGTNTTGAGHFPFAAVAVGSIKTP